jgi:MoxR-like ATPase
MRIGSRRGFLLGSQQREVCVLPLNAHHQPLHPDLAPVLSAAGNIIVGNPRVLRLALACLLAEGHLLVEDIPGVGKTTLAHVLASLLGLSFQRIQFTSDLLPADVLGVSIYDRETGAFRFHPGPVFAQVLLADEINRATPKAQSALLEAMEERQVTTEGKTRALPEPFFVIATQNPQHQIGTFPLPESQLDRFLMRLTIGYPDRDSERALLRGEDPRRRLERVTPMMDAEQLGELQRRAGGVHVAEALLDYVQALLEFSRTTSLFVQGLSPRAGLALMRAARAWAFLHAREMVVPEDVQTVLGPVVHHRLRLRESEGGSAGDVLLDGVPIP